MIYDFLIYNIKVSFCIAMLYMSYRLIVHASTRHQFNKGVLFVLLMVSMVIPLINIDLTPDRNIILPQIINLNNAVETTHTTSISITDIVAILFLAGVAVSIIKYIISTISVINIIKNSKRHRIENNITLCVTSDDVQPFNWFRYIVISHSDYHQRCDEILIHEKAHLQSCHTIELTLVRLLSAIQWYNPFMWLILRDVRAIHEYQADEAVINKGIDTTKYQLLLIDRTVSGRCISCTNNFGQVKLKNRIIMMTKKTTTKWAYLKLLYIAPAIAIAMMSFSCISCTPTEKAKPTQTNVQVEVKGSLPIILLEGKEITTEEMNKLDTNTIESLIVLKGDSAITKYGQRAIGGAIEIKLK